MQRSARLSKQALIERVAHESVLERIVVRLAFLMDQIEPLHRRQTPIDIGFTDNGGQQLWFKLSADHRGRLEERAVILREAVDASGQQALHTRREGCRNHVRVKVQFAGCGAYYTPPREEANNLPSKGWIPSSLLTHLPHERLGESIDPKPSSYK